MMSGHFRTMHEAFSTVDSATVQNERLELLHKWQRFYNMEPRSDSRLTQLYVEGRLDWPVSVVARELVATEFIFKNTLYGEVIEDFMRRVALTLRSMYKLSWTSTWEIVRFYAPIALKLMLLDRSGLRIPNFLSPISCTPNDSHNAVGEQSIGDRACHAPRSQ